MEAVLQLGSPAVEARERLVAFMGEVADGLSLARQRSNALLYVRGLIEHRGRKSLQPTLFRLEETPARYVSMQQFLADSPWRSASSASMSATIAVGTVLADGPPRRSQRALLTHWAPDLGASVESLIGPGMCDADGREPSFRVAAYPLPGEAVSLAAAPERPVPEPHDLVAEGHHLVDVAGHGVVGEVTMHHGP